LEPKVGKRGEASSELPVKLRLGRQGREGRRRDRKGGGRALKGQNLCGATPGAWAGGVGQLELPGRDSIPLLGPEPMKAMCGAHGNHSATPGKIDSHLKLISTHRLSVKTCHYIMSNPTTPSDLSTWADTQLAVHPDDDEVIFQAKFKELSWR
jgi:hypothetical protein